MAEQQNDSAEVIEDVEDLPEDTAELDLAAEARKREGIAKRYKTQNQKLKDELAAERAKSSALAKNGGAADANKQGFDYAEKAFLKASGIAPGEYALVQEVMQSTGKSLDDVLESRFFQAELKEQRETAASKDAVPSATKRSSSPTRDTVEYWIAKGELPPADQRELRTKVVNAKIKAAKEKSHFTDTNVA